MTQEDKNSIIFFIFKYINKFFYSCYFLIFIFILTVFFFVLNIKTILIILLILPITLIWIFKSIYVKTNKKNKYGILIILNNCSYYSENINNFFKKLKFDLKDDFEITTVNTNFFRKFEDKQRLEKLGQKNNYQMLITLYALEGLDNSDNLCSIDINSVLVKIPSAAAKITNKLNDELNNSFNKIIKIYQKNSYNDIRENTFIMENSIKYITSIIYILFNDLNNAKKILEKIDINENYVNAQNVELIKYIKYNSKIIYMEIHMINISKILNNYKYLYDDNEKQKLLDYISDLEKILQKCTPPKYIILFNNDAKAKLAYANGNIDDAYKLTFINYKKDPDNQENTLSLAFLYSETGQIKKAIKYYKSSLKSGKINLENVQSCFDFIENAGQLLKSKLASGILNYYYKDKILGQKIIYEFATSQPDEIAKLLKDNFK